MNITLSDSVSDSVSDSTAFADFIIFGLLFLTFASCCFAYSNLIEYLRNLFGVTSRVCSLKYKYCGIHSEEPETPKNHQEVNIETVHNSDSWTVNDKVMNILTAHDRVLECKEPDL
jgi:hypothetical protein